MNIIEYFATINRKNLSKCDMEIVNQLEENIDKIENSTLNELAQIVYTSNSTLFRIVKKLGFDSFSDFKYAVKNSLDDYDKYNHKNDNYFLKKVIQAIEKTDVLIDGKIRKAAEEIINSENLYIYGTGWKQSREIESFAPDLSFYNIHFETIRSIPEFSRIKMNNKSLIILVSFSGNLNNYYNIVKNLKSKGVKIIGISIVSDNLLNNTSDISLQYVQADVRDTILHWQTITITYILERLIYEVALITRYNK